MKTVDPGQILICRQKSTSTVAGIKSEKNGSVTNRPYLSVFLRKYSHLSAARK